MKTYSQILNENRKWAEEIFAKIDKKMSQVAIRSRDKLPAEADENGIHDDKKPVDPQWWTNGFFGSMNLLLYEYTGNEEYLKTAKASEKSLDLAFANLDKLNHDVGFMWHILSGAIHKLTGDENSRTRNLFMACHLSARYVYGGDYISAWPSSPRYSIIDCMMNLPILYWASEQIGDDRFKRIALAHADMTERHHIRDDGSVIHIVEHDRDNDAVIATHGGQGYCDGSSWSRGQAWALYGFIISYIHTGEVRYLNAAKRVANYFIAACSDDWLPRVDFRAPAEPVYYDTTAAGCAACGLIELAKALPENEGGMYMNGAVNILRAVTEKCSNFDPSNDTMILYGTRRYPTDGMSLERAGVHTYLVYSDFYYTEAILKLLGSEFFVW